MSTLSTYDALREYFKWVNNANNFLYMLACKKRNTNIKTYDGIPITDQMFHMSATRPYIEPSFEGFYLYFTHKKEREE